MFERCPAFANKEDKTTILYYQNVDIDGLLCRRDLSDLIKKTGRKQKYNRAHEWCCGHGAIGFRLLEDNICETLVLTDKFGPAMTCCDFTVALNELQDLVTLYETDSLANIPTHEKWDLFVVNPPWKTQEDVNLVERAKKFLPDENFKRLTYDEDAQVHKNLYQYVSQYLTDDADVYVYEDETFSNPETWKPYYENSGLKLYNVYKNFGPYKVGYVMHFTKEKL